MNAHDMNAHDMNAHGLNARTATPFGTFFLPGPTEVRREVLETMLAPMLPHRGAEFEAMFGRIVDSLKPIFRTTRPVYVSTSSATGFMEMAVRCSPPGAILSLVNGAFSERFADIARSCDRDVTVLQANWGDVVSLDQVEEALRAKRYVALTVVHSETSTGALTPLEPLAKLARAHDVLVLVDSVTGVAGAPVETDAWDLDVVLTGSQKALALPPGLAFAAVSERFLERASHATARGRYFDVLEFEQYAKKNQTPNTPAVSLLYATLFQCEQIARDGIEQRWARHSAMQQATREAILAQRELAVREEDIARQTIMAAGGDVVDLTPAERAAFVQAVKPLHDEARGRFGEAFALLEAARKST